MADYNTLVAELSSGTPTLIVFQGLPGAGKSTIARELCTALQAQRKTSAWFEADTWMGPHFDASRLNACHTRCLEAVSDAMHAFTHVVCVSNTNTTLREIMPYILNAQDTNYDVRIFNLFDAGLTDDELAKRTLHGVPVTKIAEMRARYQHIDGVDTGLSQPLQHGYLCQLVQQHSKGKSSRAITLPISISQILDSSCLLAALLPELGADVLIKATNTRVKCRGPEYHMTLLPPTAPSITNAAADQLKKLCLSAQPKINGVGYVRDQSKLSVYFTVDPASIAALLEWRTANGGVATSNHKT